MSTVLRRAEVIGLSRPDREALRKLTTSLVNLGALTDDAQAEFARELSDAGLDLLLSHHYTDVTQTAIDSLGILTKRRVIARLDSDTQDARELRASILATVEYFQTELRKSRP